MFVSAAPIGYAPAIKWGDHVAELLILGAAGDFPAKVNEFLRHFDAGRRRDWRGKRPDIGASPQDQFGGDHVPIPALDGRAMAALTR
jgi:hypothetical protein